MSDALIDRPRTNDQVAQNPAAEVLESQANQFDIVQILWRWKWLPIIGSLIGAGLGFLYFSQQPATYEAYALVQVINNIPISPRTQFFEPADKGITRADESLVIRSQAVLLLAVAKGNLNQQSDTDFQNLRPNEVVALLKKKRSPLVIEPADKDDNTTLIRISYVSENAEFASKVVTAIVEGYGEYLEKEYKGTETELGSLLSNAKKALAEDFKRLGDELKTFQEERPDVIWQGEDTKDHFAEAYRTFEEKRSQHRTERELLETVFNRAKAALDAGREPEPILLMIDTVGNNLNAQENWWYTRQSRRPDDPEFDLQLDLLSHKMETEQLFPLKMKENVLMEKWGEGHPSVTAIRQQIEATTKQIEKQRESERMLDQERRSIKREAEANDGILLSIAERLATRMTALAEQIAALKEQEENIRVQAAEALERSKEIGIQLSEFRIKNQELDATRALLDGYVEKMKDMDLLPKLGQRTLKKLDMPPERAPFYGPKVPIYLLGGAAVGFILLSGLAVLMDLADRSYRNPSEIANDLNVNVLGHIPVMDISKVKQSIAGVDPSVCSIHHSKGRTSEAYRTIRTAIYFSNRSKKLKVIQVTSPVPGDGKSTLACNMAVTMAQSGRRVLLIDADLRRPRVAKIFGIESEIGIAAVVSGKAEIEDAIMAGPVANLSILPGGKRPNNPAEILSSERFSNMIGMLRDKFDVIIIDTPPLLAVSDPGAVAGMVDGVVLTMRLRRNVKPLAARAKSILDSVGANLLGVVVNGVSSEAGYGYNYDYNDYRYAYKHGSNYRSGYGYRYGYGNDRYGYTDDSEPTDVSQPRGQDA